MVIVNYRNLRDRLPFFGDVSIDLLQTKWNELISFNVDNFTSNILFCLPSKIWKILFLDFRKLFETTVCWKISIINFPLFYCLSLLFSVASFQSKVALSFLEKCRLYVSQPNVSTLLTLCLLQIIAHKFPACNNSTSSRMICAAIRKDFFSSIRMPAEWN